MDRSILSVNTKPFQYILIFCLGTCLGQRDCTGVDCPVLDNCIEEALERGACCAACQQRGCTCEGYQYYDCVNAGFRNGKVPEGESYFVDFGSTECACPEGGGRIGCHFIPCSEIPPNCIDVAEPPDGCPQCERIGCVHHNQKYDAGHSFQMDECQVCHCPNDGGSLMCSPVPNCDPQSKPMLPPMTEDSNSHLNDLHTNQQKGAVDLFSKPQPQPHHTNSLQLYNEGPMDLEEDEDYDYPPASTTTPPPELAQPTEPAVTSVSHAEAQPPQGSSHKDIRQQLRERLGTYKTETRQEEITLSPPATDQTTESFQEEMTTSDQEIVPGSPSPPQEPGDGQSRRHIETERQNPLRGITHTAYNGKEVSHNTHHVHRGDHGAHAASSSGRTEQHFEEHRTQNKHKHNTLPTLRFNPTNPPPVNVKEDNGHAPRRQSQTLFNYQAEREEEKNGLYSQSQHHEVSAKDLVEVCCEAGEKWASAHGHCNNMVATRDDPHSICWTAQKQCCLGSLRESKCFAGLNTARGGDACEADDSDGCGADSYKECCSCCSLGLRFSREGQQCEAHQYLGYPCSHVFLTCCEGEEGTSRNVLREEPMLEPTAWPKRVSDSPFPKEAFSLSDAEDTENTVEAGREDLDECQMSEGTLCHHKCINTQGSYKCACLPGYVLQQDGSHCLPETADEENRLREHDVPATELTPSVAPTTQTPVYHDPCEGNGPCMQKCSPVAGRSHCSCFPGFSLMADGHSCEDINECSMSTHACQVNERCINTAGHFVCERQIVCPTGYQVKNDVCEDIDECSLRTHNCGMGFECQNTAGSFSCWPKVQCSTGFTQDTLGHCVDVNECSSVSQPCSPGFNCINAVGSYTCQRKIIMCSRGYNASPDGARCIDADECLNSLHRCGEGQICHNLPGTYRCDCHAGYQYDMFRKMCVDVNECWRYPGRLCAQTCENTPGSYQCSCTAGFSLSSDGKNCEDVNECLNNPCSQECTNLYGSYQCYCRQGYYLREDGHSCEDIDECSQSIGHLCAFKCVNVPGSYQCACPEHGYSMSPNRRSCRDIDECAIGAHNCSTAETCYNIQGDFRCLSFSCPPNYRRVSDTRCERISCPNFVDCQNSPLRITYYQLSFQTNIIIPAQIFRIGPSPAYSGDNIIISITQGNEENYFSTRKLNTYTGAVYLHQQVREPRDFLIDVEMKLWRQGTFTTFLARIYVFITANSL